MWIKMGIKLRAVSLMKRKYGWVCKVGSYAFIHLLNEPQKDQVKEGYDTMSIQSGILTGNLR